MQNLASIQPRTSPQKFKISFPPRQFNFISLSHRAPALRILGMGGWLGVLPGWIIRLVLLDSVQVNFRKANPYRVSLLRPSLCYTLQLFNGMRLAPSRLAVFIFRSLCSAGVSEVFQAELRMAATVRYAASRGERPQADTLKAAS